jgi:hypothetical protein
MGAHRRGDVHNPLCQIVRAFAVATLVKAFKVVQCSFPCKNRQADVNPGGPEIPEFGLSTANDGL